MIKNLLSIGMLDPINRNARPNNNNNQLITYFEHVSYLQRIHTIPCRIYIQYLAQFQIFLHVRLSKYTTVPR